MKANIVTPCFVFNEDDFANNLKNFHMVLNKYFTSSIIGYSFKTNSLPRLIQVAKENGCWAEVVSDDEFELAEELGFAKDKIIFNGPVKSKEFFIKAVLSGSIVNIDSRREIKWIKEMKSFEPLRIGIRVNFNLEAQLPGHTSTKDEGGRFGFCYENGC